MAKRKNMRRAVTLPPVNRPSAASHPMVSQPLFTTLDIEGLTSTALRAAAARDLALHTVSVTWRWTPSRGINIYTFAYKIGTAPWVDVLQQPHVDNSGAATALLGRFPSGTVVTCGFRVLAIQEVPHIIVIASQVNPPHREKALPAPPPLDATKALGVGERWEATFNYTVQ